MTSVTAKALLHLEQTPLENQEFDDLFGDLESLTIGNLDDIISDRTLPIQDMGVFEHIQRLDSTLRTQVLDTNYIGPLWTTTEMQQYAPESYYGYQRLAQVYLIYNDCASAAKQYIKGQENTVHGIELLRKSAETSLHIFDQALSELAQSKRFDDAKVVTDWIISFAPTLPMGYLRAAEMYELQGIAKSAIEVYAQGMSRVSIDNRDLFAKCITRLQGDIDQTIYCDLIVQLPLEVTFEIAQHLTVRQRIECLGVSKGWEDRIKQCPEAWCVLDVDRDCQHVNITTIQHIKRLVRQVTMGSTSDNPSLVEDILVSISNGEFESLTYLSLDHSVAASHKYIPRLIKIFECVNLTRLDLKFNVSADGEFYIGLHQVLGSCSHLKRLLYHTNHFPEKVDNKLFPKVPPMITELSIGGYPCSVQTTGNTPYFVQLIPHFPHLVSLCITASAPGELNTIAAQCSNLRQLEVLDHLAESILDSSPIATSTPKGLQYLRVKGYTNPKDVADVIVSNAETLISVSVFTEYETDWDGQLLVDPDWDWEHIPGLKCPALKELFFETDYYWPFEQWIGDCPSLEEIRIAEAEDLTESIFDALKKLPALRTLNLEGCEKLTDSRFSHFFQDIQSQGSQLHSVVIRCCDLISTETLLSLVALDCLQSLSIYSCSGITGDAFQDFAARVSVSNSIKLVSLGSLNGVKDHPLLQLIHSLPRLEYLDLEFLNNITNDSLYDIANLASRTNLTKLNIYFCKQITPGAIRRIEKLLNVSYK